MMMGDSYRFMGYGASARVDAPHGITLLDLKSFVAPELSAEQCGDGHSDLHLTRWSGEYHLVYGQRRYGPYRTLENGLRGVANAIHFIVGKRSPLTFLHAGAVEIDGRAVVFPARSRWGKSRLVASLVDQGCGYLSDEYAVISSDGAIFPLSKPIRLRIDGSESTVDIVTKGARAPGGFPCGAVILTKYIHGVSWDPRIVTRGQAALDALPFALQSRDLPDQVLTAVTAMVRNAACYRGDRDSSEPTISTIRALINTGRVSQGVRA